MGWERLLFYIVLLGVVIVLGLIYDRYDTRKIKKERESFQYRGRSGGFGAGGGDSGGCGGDGC